MSSSPYSHGQARQVIDLVVACGCTPPKQRERFADYIAAQGLAGISFLAPGSASIVLTEDGSLRSDGCALLAEELRPRPLALLESFTRFARPGPLLRPSALAA